MLFTILSPAKKMQFSPEISSSWDVTIPQFLHRTEALAAELKSLSPESLNSLMGVSNALGMQTYQRFQDWRGLKLKGNHCLPAGSVFSGDAFRGLDFSSLDDASKRYAQGQLRILSGFYGILRPLDLIEAYRLEMGGAFKVGGKQSLYAYWRDPLNEALKTWLQNTPGAILVNLASGEYSKVVQFSRLGIPFIELRFLDSKDGQHFRSVSSYAKYARGLMARYIIENRLCEIEQLQDFNCEGYVFDERESSDRLYTFKRIRSS